MSERDHAIFAYLATLGAIVILALAGAAICIFADFTNEEMLAKALGALTFIGGAVTGLIGVIGTFRPKGPPVASTQSGDVNVGSETP